MLWSIGAVFLADLPASEADSVNGKHFTRLLYHQSFWPDGIMTNQGYRGSQNQPFPKRCTIPERKEGILENKFEIKEYKEVYFQSGFLFLFSFIFCLCFCLFLKLYQTWWGWGMFEMSQLIFDFFRQFWEFWIFLKNYWVVTWGSLGSGAWYCVEHKVLCSQVSTVPTGYKLGAGEQGGGGCEQGRRPSINVISSPFACAFMGDES